MVHWPLAATVEALVNHTDFYTAVATLAPVFIAASFFTYRKQLKTGLFWPALRVLGLVFVPGLVNFGVGIAVLGEVLGDTLRDAYGLRLLLAILVALQFTVAAGGFAVQAIGDDAAHRDLKWRRGSEPAAAGQ
jgi:hypothetical protein